MKLVRRRGRRRRNEIEPKLLERRLKLLRRRPRRRKLGRRLLGRKRRLGISPTSSNSRRPSRLNESPPPKRPSSRLKKLLPPTSPPKLEPTLPTPLEKLQLPTLRLPRNPPSLPNPSLVSNQVRPPDPTNAPPRARRRCPSRRCKLSPRASPILRECLSRSSSLVKLRSTLNKANRRSTVSTSLLNKEDSPLDLLRLPTQPSSVSEVPQVLLATLNLLSRQQFIVSSSSNSSSSRQDPSADPLDSPLPPNPPSPDLRLPWEWASLSQVPVVFLLRSPVDRTSSPPAEEFQSRRPKVVVHPITSFLLQGLPQESSEDPRLPFLARQRTTSERSNVPCPSVDPRTEILTLSTLSTNLPSALRQARRLVVRPPRTRSLARRP